LRLGEIHFDFSTSNMAVKKLVEYPSRLRGKQII